MTKKLVLSTGPHGRTCWHEAQGLEHTEDLEKLGTLPVTGVEVYLAATSMAKGRPLSVRPESEVLTQALCEWVAEGFGRMPKVANQDFLRGLNLAPFQAEGLSLDLDQEWVFYGGSFNPWHRGHQACLDLMPKGPQLIVVPDRNPWKPSALSLSWAQLWELTLRVHESGHSLYPGFFMMNQTNPTVDWLSQVEGKKSFLIGDDNLCQIKKWKDHESLLSCLTCLYVAPRQVAPGLNSSIEESLDYVRSFGVRVQRLGHHDYEHLSSTQLRAKKRPS